MAFLDEQGLKTKIKQEEYDNVYFIYGEESYLKTYYVQQLKKKIVDPTFADFNCHVYENKNSTMSDILRDAETLPMMSRYTFVLVYDFPFDKKDDIEELKKYLKDVPDTSVLVFVFENIDPDPKKNSKWKSIINAVSKSGSVVCLEKRSEGELVKMLVSGAKKRKAVLQPDVARYLISVSGSDIETLLHETEKLSMYVNGGEITKDLVDKMATKCLQARVYDLSKWILKGDCTGASEVLGTLFELGEDPIGVLAVIANCYVDMYRVKCAKIAGETHENVGKHYNYKGREFLLRNALRDSAKLSVSDLRKSLDVLTRTDNQLKSTAVDKRILLEECVVKLSLIAGAGR